MEHADQAIAEVMYFSYCLGIHLMPHIAEVMYFSYCLGIHLMPPHMFSTSFDILMQFFTRLFWRHWRNHSALRLTKSTVITAPLWFSDGHWSVFWPVAPKRWARYKQEAHQLVGRQSAGALEFDPKPSEAAFSTVFRCGFRPEVDSDVISGANVGQVGMGVPVKFGDSIPNGSRDIQQRSRRMRHFRPLFELR